MISGSVRRGLHGTMVLCHQLLAGAAMPPPTSASAISKCRSLREWRRMLSREARRSTRLPPRLAICTPSSRNLLCWSSTRARSLIASTTTSSRLWCRAQRQTNNFRKLKKARRAIGP
ncbi:unnamed protein product [Polarella glacialis]|uniref:Secreted protein n=1 Tax=Polarella glacialis TaxID=89957 RepID=A0A813D6B1_POLGL|nr:unnamed protein product [Polarella glacialis]